MATKKKSTSKGRVKVNKLKVQKDKVQVLTVKDSKRLRGGVAPRIPLKKIKID